MPPKTRITIRIAPSARQALVLEARRCGRPFSEHVRRKLEQPVESVEERLARVERKALFVALAIEKLFEGLDLDRHLDPLMAATLDDKDPFEPEQPHAF